jgi:hypothetical protein
MSALIWNALFLGLIIALVIYTRRHRAPNVPTLSQFATSHNLTYTASPHDLLDPAMFASLGDPTRKISVTLRDSLATPAGRDVFFASVNFPDAPSRDGSNSTNLELLASSQPPHIEATFMLLPKGREQYFNIQGLQPVSFEGVDLNDIYKLLVKPGDEVNTLQLLAPDTMVWLVKANPKAAVVQQNGSQFVLMPDVTSMASTPGTLTSFDYQFQLITSICDRLNWEVK